MSSLPAWLAFAAERLPELQQRLGEQLVLAAGATLAGAALAVPLAIVSADRPRLRAALLGLTGALQTVPRLALLVGLMALLGESGARPAVIALTVCALFPIMRAALLGLEGARNQADRGRPEARDDGRSARDEQAAAAAPKAPVLARLAMAAPLVLDGIRVAAVSCVGAATLAALVGAGGLGQLILRGLSIGEMRLALLGALPAAALALVVDGSLAAASWGARARSRRGPKARPALARLAIAAPLVLLLLAGAVWASPPPLQTVRAVRVGSKDSPEQILLGEILAQALEARGIPVHRQLSLGGTASAHRALTSGAIDVYVEYTGDALTEILGDSASDSPDQRNLIRREYSERFNCEWLAPLGFESRFALAVRQDVAARRRWRTISDLVGATPLPRLVAPQGFEERPDGLPGLERTYGLLFASRRELDLAPTGRSDVFAVLTTDARLGSDELVLLEDDRAFFRPYQAVPVARRVMLARWPAARGVLGSLAGTIDTDAMRAMNAALGAGRHPGEVAAEHLRRAAGGP